MKTVRQGCYSSAVIERNDEMDNIQPKDRWAASFRAQIIGYALAIAGFFLWVVTDGRSNGGYYTIAGMLAIEPAAIIGALCYLAAIMKPLADKRLHPMLFGTAFLAISAIHAW